MSLSESIVENAALAMPAATLTPALSQRERRGGAGTSQGILVSSKPIERRLNP
jgi:hypothetical protein